MAGITEGEFNGMACHWLGNEHVRLAVTIDRGPRVVFWGLRDGANLFAELPDAIIKTPDGDLGLLGGHRLWYAPEVMSRTYWPDNDPVKTEELPGGAAYTAPSDGAGIVKQIAVRVSPDAPEVTVTHTLTNAGRWAVELAPWALSMCRVGGTAILPQPEERTDPDGFLPNRRINLWPYSDITDARLTLGNKMTLITVTPGPNNKIGYRNTHGWFGYLLDGILFTKHFDPQLAGEHPDQSSNAEFFFSESSIELESLAPLVTLEPGAQTSHVEVWRLREFSGPVDTEADALALSAMVS